MKFLTRYNLWLKSLCALLSILTAGVAVSSCSEENEPRQEAVQRHSQLTIHITTGDSSRGTHDYEYESVVSREQSVRELTVLLYFSPNGLNGAPETPIYLSHHFTPSEFIQNGSDITVNIEGDDEHKIYDGSRVVVLANMGDCTHLTTLGEVQQFVPEATFSTTSTGSFDPADFQWFAMSNENNTDGVIRVQSTGLADGDKAYTATVAIQRLAARIDYDLAGSEEQIYDYVLYQAVNVDGDDAAYVYVTHVTPVNVMKQPTYAIQRTTTGLSDDKSCFDSWQYAMPLRCDQGLKPLSYVVEPHTVQKASLDYVDDWYGKARYGWGGDTRADLILAMGHDYFDAAENSDMLTIRQVLDNENTKGTTYSDNIRILAYANENTQHLSDLRAECLTGLVIRAIYCPRYVYADEYLSEWDEYPDVDPVTGRTIDYWRYTPTITTTNEGNVLYFKDEATALAYSRMHPDDYAEIKEFPGGICYYNTWLKNVIIDKHNTTYPSSFPMEFAVVRNHVYRVAFRFLGIGREGIRIEEPDNVELTVTVRPWREIDHDEIIM